MSLSTALQKLHTFITGTTASATEVNANLDYAINSLNTTNAYVNDIESGVKPVANATKVGGYTPSQAPTADQVPVIRSDSLLVLPGATYLPNNVAYSSKTADGTNRPLLYMAVSDRIVIGSNNHDVVMQGSIYDKNDLPVWSQSNDGAGSGLDADKLDGQEGSYYQPASDERLKTNIVPLSEFAATEIVTGLESVVFDWNSLAEEVGAAIENTGEHEIGFKAQQVQTVLPEAVRNWINPDYLTIDIRPIVAAQNVVIKNLLARIEALEAAI